VLMLKYQMPRNEHAACPNMPGEAMWSVMSSFHRLDVFLQRCVFVGDNACNCLGSHQHHAIIAPFDMSDNRAWGLSTFIVLFFLYVAKVEMEEKSVRHSQNAFLM